MGWSRSSTISDLVPGGKTLSVFRNSIIDPLTVGIQVGEILLAGLGLACVRHNGLPDSSELAVVVVIRTAADVPKPLVQEKLLSSEESPRPGWLILIERLGVRIVGSAGNIVKLKVGIGRRHE